MQVIPQKITRAGTNKIEIEWKDGHKSLHHLYVLRKFCPCASCQTVREAGGSADLLPVLQPGQNELRDIKQVGNYAIQLIWEDGHTTGIYTYDLLRRLCECEECRKTFRK